MSHVYDGLPRQVPDGTRYVVEGEPVPGGSRITASYLIFPDGQRLDLPTDSGRIMTCACAGAVRPGQPRRAKVENPALVPKRKSASASVSYPTPRPKRARSG